MLSKVILRLRNFPTSELKKKMLYWHKFLERSIICFTHPYQLYKHASMALYRSQDLTMKRLFPENEVAKWSEFVSARLNRDWQTKLAVACQEEDSHWAWNRVHTSYCLTIIIILGAALWASQHSLAGLFPPQFSSSSPLRSFSRWKDNGTACLSAVNTHTSSKTRWRAVFFFCVHSEQLDWLAVYPMRYYRYYLSQHHSINQHPWFLFLQSHAWWWSVMAVMAGDSCLQRL